MSVEKCSLEEAERLKQFLSRYPTAPGTIYAQIKKAVPGLPLPIAQSTTDGAMQFCWMTNRQAVEIDIYEDGTFQWWWRNRVINQSAGSDEPLTDIPIELISKLRLFAND